MSKLAFWASPPAVDSATLGPSKGQNVVPARWYLSDFDLELDSFRLKNVKLGCLVDGGRRFTEQVAEEVEFWLVHGVEGEKVLLYREVSELLVSQWSWRKTDLSEITILDYSEATRWLLQHKWLWRWILHRCGHENLSYVLAIEVT